MVRNHKHLFIWNIVLLIVFFGIMFLNSCANCSGPDINGEYVCEENGNDGGSSGSSTSYSDDDDDSFVIHFESEEEESCTPLPDNKYCYSKRGAPVEVTVDVGSPSGKMPYKINYYAGKFENGYLLESTSGRVRSINLKSSDTQLSAAAFYQIGKDTVVAVDGEMIGTNSEAFCEDICYTADPVYLDLRIK